MIIDKFFLDVPNGIWSTSNYFDNMLNSSYYQWKMIIKEMEKMFGYYGIRTHVSL